MGDLILFVLLLIGVLDGWRHGIVKLLGNIGGVLVGIIAARRLTPLLLPALADKVGLALYGAAGTEQSRLVAGWFFTETAAGRLAELVLFILLTAIVTWLVHFLVNAAGRVVNATPLVGFVSRVLGACLELFFFAMVLYFIYKWFLPWLVGVAPGLAVLDTIFTSSKYVLPVVLDIGSLVWATAVQAIGTQAALAYLPVLWR